MGRGPSRRGPQRSGTTIEFLAPDEQVFGDDAGGWGTEWVGEAPRFAGDRRASRGVTAATAIAALAILAGGTIAAVQVTERNDRPRPDTRGVPLHERNTAYDGGGDTPDRPGRLATRSLFDEPLQDGRFPVNPWVMEVPTDADPVGFTLVETPLLAPGWFELWSGPRAGRTVGRWLAVQIVPGEAPAPAPEVEVTTITLEGRDLREWTSRDGVAQIQFAPAEGWGAQVTAFGWSADELRNLAASMEVVDGRPVYGDPDPRSDDLVVARPTSNLLFELEFIGGTVTSAVEWRTEDGRSVTLTVATAQRDTDALDQFVLTTAAGTPLSGPDVRHEVGTFDATAGRFPGLDDRNVVRWTVGNDAIALTGDLPVDELLELATTARPATGVEWVEIYEQVRFGDEGTAASPDEVDPQ